MSERIDETQTRHVAKLARLALSDDEIVRYSAQLSEILKYVHDIQGLDTDKVEPFSHAPAQTDTLRADVPLPGLTPEQTLGNAPRTLHGCFRVPACLPRDVGG